MYRSNFFGFDEWKSQGLPISSTSSTEAVKLYDAAVTQFFTWYDDPNFGGLKSTVMKIYETDPEFVLGNAFALSTQLLGFVDTYYDSSDVQERIDSLQQLADARRTEITPREYDHVQAVVALAHMDWEGAADIWDRILVDHPTDCHAIKMAFFTRFFTGNAAKQRAMVERVYPVFQTRKAMHSDLTHGLMGFVLEENGLFSEAEKYARMGLEANGWDGWATHTMAHIYEMTGRFEEGLRFMSSRSPLWTKANHLGCHNYWHHSLFNIATGDFDGALDLFDNQIRPRMQATQTAFSVVDSSSLMQRLLFVDPRNRSFGNDAIEERCKDVFDVAKQYIDRHVLGFTNAHYLMACLGSGNNLEATELVDSFKDSKLAELHPDYSVMVRKLMSAIVDYDREQYDKATDTLNSIKDSVYMLGGSNAQRDVFSQLHLVCALKSSKDEHKKTLQDLVKQREVFEQNDQYLLGKVVTKK